MLRLFILCLQDLGNGLGLLDLLLLLSNLGPQGVDLILESLSSLLCFFILSFRGIFVGSGGLLRLSTIYNSIFLFSRGCESLRQSWDRIIVCLVVDLGGGRLHLHACLLPAYDLLCRRGGPHLLLLLQKLEASQVLVELLQTHVLLRLFLNAHLVPSLDDSILCLGIVHEFVAYRAACLTLLFSMLFQRLHSVVDLAALILREEQDLVGTLNEDLLLGPEARDIADLL